MTNAMTECHCGKLAERDRQIAELEAALREMAEQAEHALTVLLGDSYYGILLGDTLRDAIAQATKALAAPAAPHNQGQLPRGGRYLPTWPDKLVRYKT